MRGLYRSKLQGNIMLSTRALKYLAMELAGIVAMNRFNVTPNWPIALHSQVSEVLALLTHRHRKTEAYGCGAGSLHGHDKSCDHAAIDIYGNCQVRAFKGLPSNMVDDHDVQGRVVYLDNIKGKIAATVGPAGRAKTIQGFIFVSSPAQCLGL